MWIKLHIRQLSIKITNLIADDIYIIGNRKEENARKSSFTRLHGYVQEEINGLP